MAVCTEKKCSLRDIYYYSHLLPVSFTVGLDFSW